MTIELSQLKLLLGYLLKKNNNYFEEEEIYNKELIRKSKKESLSSYRNNQRGGVFSVVDFSKPNCGDKNNFEKFKLHNRFESENDKMSDEYLVIFNVNYFDLG